MRGRAPQRQVLRRTLLSAASAGGSPCARHRWPARETLRVAAVLHRVLWSKSVSARPFMPSGHVAFVAPKSFTHVFNR